MFDTLFNYPAVILRHRTGPLLEERLAFLTHLANQGYSRRQLRRKANDLLRIAQILGLASRPQKAMTCDEIKRKTANQRRLYSLASRWLQFMGSLQLRPVPVTPIEKKIKAFADYMANEEELAPTTIYTRCWFVRQFFDQLHVKGGSLHKITPHRIDMAFPSNTNATCRLRPPGWGSEPPAAGGFRLGT